MPEYTKPPFNNVPFTFTSGGYTAPDFDSVAFRFGRPRTAASADIAAFIRVVQHPAEGAQLTASITALEIAGIIDITAFLRAANEGTSNVSANIRGFVSEASADVTGSITPVLYSNTADIAALINLIEIRNLTASITSQLNKGEEDLGAYFWRVVDTDYRNLTSSISGAAGNTIQASLNPIYYKDLPAYIYGGTYNLPRDISAYITGYLPVNIAASIHGWQLGSLYASITGGYGPGDIQASVFGFPPSSLSAYISGFFERQAPRNIGALIEYYSIGNLQGLITPIDGVNLYAIINSLGGANGIAASIFPKIVHMKRAIAIPLLEHLGLKGVINVSCATVPQQKDLSAYIRSSFTKELSAYIIGWRNGEVDGMSSLGAYINTEELLVEDRLIVNFVPQFKHARLKLRFQRSDGYQVFDTLGLQIRKFTASSLSAYITGTNPTQTTNLSGYLKPIFDRYYSELPDHINPKTHQIVINLERFEEQWRRTVEILFDSAGTTPFNYFYVSAANSVYKIDKSRRWTIWASSYDTTSGDMVARRNVRRKFVVDFSSYSNIDEAVRDLIDKVAYYSRTSLSASIISVLPINVNLRALIAPMVKYTWLGNLGASVQGYAPSNMSAAITPQPPPP